MPDHEQNTVSPPVPEHLIERADVAVACATHDFATLFVLIKRYGGVSQNRIAAALDMSPSRVGEIIHGRRRITTMDVITRISDRFAIPGRMLGLARRPWEDAIVEDLVTSALMTLGRRGGVSANEVQQFAVLLGNVVDLDRAIDIEIARDGRAKLDYSYSVLNLTSQPLARLPRDLWFEHTDGSLVIAPADRVGCRRMTVQRVHDTPNLAKFACLVSPPIKSGESANVAYVCSGGRFIESLYWRESVSRYTGRMTINLRQRNGGRLINCTATEEHSDGTENSVTQNLVWDHDDKDISITLDCEFLRPGQAVTLRWEIDRACS